MTPMTRTHSHQLPNTRRMPVARRGNLLVGCGVVLLVLFLIAGIGIFYVVSNARSWTASASANTIDAVLTKAQIDPDEHAEIMTHVQTLMTRFEDGDIEWKQLGEIVQELVESPVIPAAMVMGIDSFYFTDSDLDETEKAQARIDLARFTQGLFDESIQSKAINDVLAPVVTNTPDDNDIRLNLTIDASSGRSITALRSADEVTDDDLRELIAIAKAKADEAEITQTPEPIDLSDEIAKAIGIALGEIADDSIEEDVEESTEDAAETSDDDEPATHDEP